MSTPSHKSSRPQKTRAVQSPQRSNGKLRFAAILDAAAAVIAAKGYEAATMAEIAERSDTKIGSLYRFFPNKESLAETMITRAREGLDIEFDKFDAAITKLTIDQLVDELQELLFTRLITPALKKLLEANQEWSVKPEEFKEAVMSRLAKSLMLYSPKLPKKAAADVALAIVLNMKTAASNHDALNATPSVKSELREMTRLYLHSRLGPKSSK